ncbi:MAG: zinc-ribbon domain containing protein [Chloroflexi bacterium]|nr:zinc-ribbon domain containing protein [Chloroflexota bacterium]
MPFQDKTLTCQDCGVTFAFSAQEQEMFANRGYQNDPKRCPDCRKARKGRTGEATGEGRQFFTAVCASCGGEARVPFQPRNNRPVYCSACFSKTRTGV